MARKRDLREIDDVASSLGMSRAERRLFGLWLENLKASGERGTKNARGDFTFDELKTYGQEFLAEVRSDS
jgi:hypothetical protein